VQLAYPNVDQKGILDKNKAEAAVRILTWVKRFGSYSCVKE